MERLQKVMAYCGVASRRKSEELISLGKVKVNGVVVKQHGTLVDKNDKIEVDGVVISLEKKVYILMNKPRNCMTTVKDDRGRPTVIELLSSLDKRVYPVGRLDFDTTGALILTNDGELTQMLTHPSNEIEKVYIATVKGIVAESKITLLEQGVSIGEHVTAPAKVSIIKYNKEKETTILKLVVHEGKNHQIKKMVEAIGYEVIKLNRESIGGITTKGLYEGQYRYLKDEELALLKSYYKK